jgi:hypothetical protein
MQFRRPLNEATTLGFYSTGLALLQVDVFPVRNSLSCKLPEGASQDA